MGPADPAKEASAADRPAGAATVDRVTAPAPEAGPTNESAELSSGTIGRRAARGLSWSLAGSVLLKLGSFVMALVVARLLVPADFGAYAVALAASHFVMHVNDLGLIAGTVQWRGRLEEMAATASSIALAFSVVLYTIVWFLAEPFASLAGAPEAAGVVRVLTFTIVIDGVTAVRAGALMRNFQQDKLTIANAAGFVVYAGLTIGLAAAGAGAYSFAWGQVAAGVITGALILIWAKVPFGLGLDRHVARRLLKFGLPLAASLGIDAIVVNAGYVIVGNALGAVALGFFLMAFNISSWVPGVIGTAVRYVSVAGFSRLSEKTASELSAGAARAVPLLVTGLVPVAVLMGTLAEPLVEVLFGQTWLPAAAVLQVLMVLALVRMLTDFAQDILIGAGATRAGLWVNLGYAVTLIPALLIGTRYGIRGAAVAHALVAVFVAVPLVCVALHRVGVRLAPIARGVVRPLLAGVLTIGVCLVVMQVDAPAVVQLLLAGLAGTATYVATGVSPSERRQAIEAVQRRRRGRVAQPAN